MRTAAPGAEAGDPFYKIPCHIHGRRMQVHRLVRGSSDVVCSKVVSEAIHRSEAWLTLGALHECMTSNS